jgi:hypothetical protein
MATHTVTHEVFYDGAWQAVTTEVHEPSNTQIARGLTQFGDIKPSTIEWQFEDPTGKWVPDNPMSPLYGKVGRALPTRVTVDGSIRAFGEAAVYAPDRTEDFKLGPPRRGRQWCDFRADGVLARIGSWTEPLRSPMYRAISRLSTLVGHWPMEEGREATQLSNTVAGGLPATARLMAFGNDDFPDGAASTIKITEADNTSRVDGAFLTNASTTAGWQVAWSMKLPILPTTVTYLQVLSWRTSNGYRWTVDVNQDSYRFRVVDSTGALLEETLVGYAPDFGRPNQWVTFRMKATASAGTVTAEFAWYVQGQTTPWGTSGTFAGTLGRLVTWTMNGNAWMNDALISHVYGVTGGTDDLLSYAARRAFDGYVGELAADRADRLLDEEGVGFSLVGVAADTMPMGRQRPATLIDHLQEIADTDRCLIYDHRTLRAIEMRTRVELYRQTPVTFAYPADIAPPFRERYDYVGVANRVTVTQRDGGEATAALASGDMSVQPAPNGIGERKAGVTVNVADEATLPLIAGWELAHGSLPGARFPEVTFDLDGTPGIAGTVSAVDIGDRITITGFRYDTLDLLVIGIREFAQRKRRKVTFTCVPGAVFAQVGAYDDAAQRFDCASTTLKTAVNSVATALTFRTADVDFESWATAGLPYDVMIAGERIRVTAMGAAALVSGALDQAATVTRSINGVVKSLAAGEEIHIATPGRYGL